MDDRRPTDEPLSPPRDPINAVRRARAVLYPNIYVWYVFLAALDIMFTYLILHPVFSVPHDPTATAPVYEEHGEEVNLLADWVIQHGGVPGMVAYKFVLVALVIGICEFVGRRSDRVGRKLAKWAVALNAFPVVVALAQLSWATFG